MLMEVFNELMVSLMVYHVIAFSDFNTSKTATFELGFSYVYCLGFEIFVNLIYILSNMLMRIRSKCRIANNKEMKKQQLRKRREMLKELKKKKKDGARQENTSSSWWSSTRCR